MIQRQDGAATRHEKDQNYKKLWRVVRGGVKDFQNAHPDEITMPNDRVDSLVKRIVGQVHSAFPGLSAERADMD